MTDQNKVIVNYSKDLTVNNINDTNTLTIQNNTISNGPYIRTVQPYNPSNTLSNSNMAAIITIPTNVSSNINLSPQDIFGPFYRGQDINLANRVQQILNGLTLPELFNILNKYGIDTNIWKDANISINENKIILKYTYSSPLTSVFNDQVVGHINKEYTLEIENINGWVVVRYTLYQSGTYMGQPFSPSIERAYYVINPITKEIIKTESTGQIATITSGYIINPGNVINEYLKSYGYKIPDEYISQIENLQPGQSITVYARMYNYETNQYGQGSAPFKITYLEYGKYKIESESPFYNPYNFYQPWTTLNTIITVPTYTYNILTNTINTTDLKVQGSITTTGAISLNLPYLETTYNINQTIPITHKIENNQIIFKTSEPKTNITLQNINLPIITTQQLQTLQSGQNLNLQPGWYYNPDTGEIIKLEYKTKMITQSENNLYTPSNIQIYLKPFGYSSLDPNVITYIGIDYDKNTIYFINSRGEIINAITFKDTQTMLKYLENMTSYNLNNTYNTIENIKSQSQIIQYSFSTPLTIGGVFGGVYNVGKGVYDWLTSITKPITSTLTNLPIIKDIYNVGKITGNQIKNTLSSVDWNKVLDIAREKQASLFYMSINAPVWPILEKDIYLKITGAKGPYAEKLHTISNYLVEAADIAQLMILPLGLGLGSTLGIGRTSSNLALRELAKDSLRLSTPELRLYTTSANIGRASLAFDALASETTQSIKFINPTLIEKETKLLTNIGNIGASENFAKTLISNAISGIKSDVKGYLKDVAIWTGVNWVGNNLVSIISGKPVTSPEYQLKLLGESAAAGVTFATLGRIFAGMAKPILSSWVKPNESLNSAIRKRFIYDVSTGFITGVGASYASQGAGVLLGLRENIDTTEALLSGGFAAGITGLIRAAQGFRALKTGNFYTFATHTEPYSIKTTETHYIELDENKGISLFRSKNIVTDSPAIGKRIITKEDIPNLKLREREFETLGIMKIDNDLDMVKIGNVIVPVYRYKAYLVSLLGKNKVHAWTEGKFFGYREPIQSEKPFESYLEEIQNIRTRLIEKEPKFKEIMNVPEKGLYLFKTLTEGTYIQTVKGVNSGKTLLKAGLDAYFNKLEKKLYDETILNAQNKIKELQLSPNEAKWELEMANQYYKEGLEILKKFKSNVENILEKDIKSLINKPEYLKVTNLQGLGNYILPEKFNINPGRLPNPEELNKDISVMGITYVKQPLSQFENINVDFNKNVIGRFRFWAFGKSYVSTGDVYKSMHYGHGLEYVGGDKTLSHIGTVYGIEKNQYGKGWYTIKQYGGIRLSENRYLSFGYGESIDPNIKMELLPSPKSVKGPSYSYQYLNMEKAKSLLVGTIRPSALPESNIRLSTYGISINIGNIYNINMGHPSPYGNNKQINDIRGKVKPIFNDIIQTNEINMNKQPSLKIFQPSGLSNNFKNDIDIRKDINIQSTNIFSIRSGGAILTSTLIIPTTGFKQIFPLFQLPTPSLKPPITGLLPLFSLRLQPVAGSTLSLNRNVKVMYDIYYALNRLR